MKTALIIICLSLVACGKPEEAAPVRIRASAEMMFCRDDVLDGCYEKHFILMNTCTDLQAAINYYRTKCNCSYVIQKGDCYVY